MARTPKRSSKGTKKGSGGNGGKDNGTSGSGAPAAPSELVVMTRPDAAMRASAGRFAALSGEPVDTLSDILSDHGASMRPMFGSTEERVLASLSRDAQESIEGEPVDLSNFYAIDVSDDEAEKLQSDLIDNDLVDAAYIKPGAEPPTFMNDMVPASEEAPPSSPDFTSRQIYLDAAPAGVDARWAWTQSGGSGAGIRIIDIEGAWRFTHEDLGTNQGGVLAGTQSSDIRWRNHGTAVLGEYSGDRNSFGVTGISPDATASAISIFGGLGSAGALNAAANRLRAGDVILIELHRPGPRHNFAGRQDQRGYIAIEWWPDDFAAIRNAVNKGIIVVEAAGNGAENLDDAIYQTPASGFPSGWTNPFRRSNRDSGAIMVGAGAPPPGTHGRNHGNDRSRLDFSNYGALIDAQGWGREVTTCGYGDLQGGSDEDLWYTDTFSGTSSASPIIVGCAASLQGMARARGKPFLTPAKFRQCLRSTGSPQQDQAGRPATQRIGNRPNMRQLVTCAFPKRLKEFKEGKEFRKELKEGRKEVKELKEGRKELKELRKEGKEIIKDLKDGRKEGKELKEGRKEFKEGKEFEKNPREGKAIEKNRKEVKEFEKNRKEKDKDKDLVEIDRNFRDRFRRPDMNAEDYGDYEGYDGHEEYEGDMGSADGSDLDGRLAAIEGAIESLYHFISGELRPDLSSSALGDGGYDPDEDAKNQKDMKEGEGF